MVAKHVVGELRIDRQAELGDQRRARRMIVAQPVRFANRIGQIHIVQRSIERAVAVIAIQIERHRCDRRIARIWSFETNRRRIGQRNTIRSFRRLCRKHQRTSSITNIIY